MASKAKQTEKFDINSIDDPAVLKAMALLAQNKELFAAISENAEVLTDAADLAFKDEAAAAVIRKMHHEDHYGTKLAQIERGTEILDMLIEVAETFSTDIPARTATENGKAIKNPVSRVQVATKFGTLTVVLS